METVTISKLTYATLITAAYQANCLWNVIKQKHDTYDSISRDEVNLLYTMYMEAEGKTNEGVS